MGLTEEVIESRWIEIGLDLVARAGRRNGCYKVHGRVEGESASVVVWGETV